MNKRHISNCGKALFIAGFIVLGLGALAFWFVSYLIVGVGFALILVSFALLAYGSRVGDKQE